MIITTQESKVSRVLLTKNICKDNNHYALRKIVIKNSEPLYEVRGYLRTMIRPTRLLFILLLRVKLVSILKTVSKILLLRIKPTRVMHFSLMEWKFRFRQKTIVNPNYLLRMMMNTNQAKRLT